jgi:hypothetical protein
MRFSTHAILACFVLLFATACGEASADILDQTGVAAPAGFDPSQFDDPSNPNSDDPGRTRTQCSAHADCPSGNACVSGYCSSIDYAFVSLSWEGDEQQPVNLDLHVIDPNGDHIYWRSTQGQSREGSFADHPECISFDCNGDEQQPMESIYWSLRDMAPGEYQVWVENVSETGKSYRLEIQAGDNPTALSNTLGGGQRSSAVTFRIEEEAPEGVSGPCYDQLRARGVSFEPMTIRENSICTVEDAVMLNTPIAGVTHRVAWATGTRRMQTSCEMALKLVDLSEVLAARGVTEVFHSGSYNCRNIAGTGTPSQHSMARAYDINGYTINGTKYEYVRHWEHNTSNPQTAGGRALRDITLAIRDAGLFNTILSPDYNRDHDDHIHVDFTGGSGSRILAHGALPQTEMDPHDADHACPNDL